MTKLIIAALVAVMSTSAMAATPNPTYDLDSWVAKPYPNKCGNSKTVGCVRNERKERDSIRRWLKENNCKKLMQNNPIKGAHCIAKR